MVKGGVPETVDVSSTQQTLLRMLEEIRDTPDDEWDLAALLRRHPRAEGTYAKSQLLAAYRQLTERSLFERSHRVEQRLTGRPVRTLSGVAPVAVLTEQHACPGECLFCPSQPGAPKSYLDGEPGVLRAMQNRYDPYDQTRSRLEALAAIGHRVDKVELLILGGTWSAYPEEYQEWFLRRCFDALNGTPSAALREALMTNASAPSRNVGLVVETRPDCMTPSEVVALRSQGVTKVQIGAQSLNDGILRLNRRGHTVEDTRRAVQLLRLAGFKVVLHWMPNLYGATTTSDLADFGRLWDDPALRPDELKIYPTVLLRDTDLYPLWEAGEYLPYEEPELIDLLARCKQQVPEYCRLNRVMRDIPASYVVAGTTKSNLRQVVRGTMAQRGMVCRCIRCREVRDQETVEADKLELETLWYDGGLSREGFLQYLTPGGHLAGFLRLSLPLAARTQIPIPEIETAAMVRELHVYGPAQALGERSDGVQHRGVGAQLLTAAAGVAREAGFRQLAVIAAAGTVDYYRQRGFTDGILYPRRNL